MAITPRVQRRAVGSPTALPSLPANFGQSNIGQQFAEAGSAIGGALERIQSRQNAVGRARDQNAFNDFGVQSLQATTTTADITDPEVVRQYNEGLIARQREILAGHQGTPESRLRLEETLERQRGAFMNQMAQASVQAGLSAVQETAGQELNQVLDGVRKNPANVEGALEDYTNKILDLSEALDPNQTRTLLRAGVSQIMETAVSGPLMFGDADAAEEILRNNPGAVAMMGPDATNKIRGQIASARAERGRATRAAQEKLAAAEFLKGGPLTPGERLELAGIARVPERAKDEFNRNLGRLIELENAGQQDTTEYKLLSQRVAKQTQINNEGLAIQFNPDGTVSAIVQGPQGAAGLGGALTGARALDEQANIDRFATIIDLLDNTIGEIRESPSRAGLAGSIRSFAQKVVGIAGDVAPDSFAETVRRSAEQFGLGSFFDPALPETEINENAIALELAKMRVTAGGGGIRAVGEAFRAAKKDVSLRGLTSSQEVITRLETVRREFETERNKLIQRLSGRPPQDEQPQESGSPSPGAPPQQAPVTATNPETGERMIFRNGRWEPLQ